MAIEERQLSVDQLQIGMYVCRLDRPWTETPYPLQGFVIRSLGDLETLGQYCRSVWVDFEKSLGPVARPMLEKLGYGTMMAYRRPAPKPVQYLPNVPLVEELPRAEAAWSNVRGLAHRIVEDIREGRRIRAEDLEEAIEPIVASVIRSADAFFWLDALRRRDAYAYSHSVNCCALAATFGRQLGFPRSLLTDLATGGMLMDLGKAMLPEDLLATPGPLSDGQRAEARRHVDYSLKLLDESGVRSPDVALMVRQHHERHDGSGYPDGLNGTKISLLGRMLGIVDTYDALCSERAHQPAMSRHDALQLLYKERDRLFQAELVEQFSQCLGVYPTGSLVELSTGEVAVVMAQNASRRLHPKVTVLTHPDKSLDKAFPQLDLWAHRVPAPASAGPDAEPVRVRIVRTLAPGSFGLDMSALFL